MTDSERVRESVGGLKTRVVFMTSAGVEQGYGNGYPLDVLNKWMLRI